jgi:hypothetical protein
MFMLARMIKYLHFSFLFEDRLVVHPQFFNVEKQPAFQNNSICDFAPEINQSYFNMHVCIKGGNTVCMIDYLPFTG